MPYISATILTQLLQMDIIPYFKELKEQGATGRQKINKINRYLGILFAFVQGYIYSVAFMGGSTVEILKTTLQLFKAKIITIIDNKKNNNSYGIFLNDLSKI